MRLKQRIGKIPDGSDPQVGLSVAVRKISDGTTITTLISDADGMVDLQANGHYEPYFLFIGNVPGGDKFLDSRVVTTAGVLPLAELPTALRAFGDGVIRGYGNEMAVSLVSNGPSVLVATGAANVAGHPVVVYSNVQLSNSRPSSGVRTDRVVLRLYPTGSGTTPGKADVVLLQGTVDAGAPALTTTSTIHEVSLYQVSVPVAGAVTLTDERTFGNEKPPVSDEVQVASASTTNASGEALSGVTVALVLPRAAVYDVTATLHALQVAVSGTWTLLNTIDGASSGLAFNSPRQVAIGPDGSIFIADSGNNRIVKLNSTGAYVSQITLGGPAYGVCVDGSGNIYTTEDANPSFISATPAAIARRKFNSAHVQQWVVSLVSTSRLRHICTDGTLTYFAQAGGTDVIGVRAASDGTSSATAYGSAGVGDGQFDAPYGVAVSVGEIYVVDVGNSRVQVLDTSGAYQRKWTIPASSRGVALDASGDVWVAVYGSDELRQYSSTGTLLATIAQANANGIGLASGDVLWVTNADGNTLAKWDEVGGGYGQVAIDIGGSVSDYTGIGERIGAVGAGATGTATGPTTLTVRAFAKATSGTVSLQGLVLSATATPRA